MIDPALLKGLLAATTRKDRSAFANLYQLTSANLNGVALRILKKRAPAEDALQEAFIQIWNRAGDFQESKGSPMAWMASIVRYRALDILRRQKPMIPIEESHIDDLNAALNPMGAQLQSDMARIIWDCLEELKPNQKTSILLSFYEGMTHEELARKIAKPIGTVKSWIRRGLQQLKGCIQP